MGLTQFNFPTPIVFGPGARARLNEILSSRGKKRPLFLTDRGVAGLPFFKEMMDSAAAAGLAPAAFSEVGGNPVESQVTKGVEAYKAHNADALVLVGGGAALDVGKAVALMVNHPGKLFDYEDGKPDALPVDKEIPFIVAIPTTAGTGSEVGRSSVISDDATHVKKIVFSPKLLAPIVLADPELTLDLPPFITAATGVDALSHNVEAFLSQGFHPMADGIALEGIRLVADNLLTCYKEPKNVDARGKMLIASSMGAVAFQKGLGVTHSCAHALSAVCDTHHGLANALMLVPCMRFNAETEPERMARMAVAVGAEPSAEGFIAWMEGLFRDLDIPKNLRAAGVTEDKLDALVDIAVQDCCHPCNPRPVTREDFVRLFNEAM
jgi:alcohol dehydrogenase class IV